MSDDAEAREKEAGLREALDAADQHLRRGRLDEAEEVYRRILALDQRHFEAMVGLGDAAMARGRPGDALLAYGAAQRQRPDGSARLFMNKGTALAAVAESDAAIACLRRACALEPDNPEILNNLGSVLAEAGQPGEAASCFRRAQSVQPDDARGHFNLGLALEGLAEEAADRRELIAEAIAAYRAALARDPAFVPAAVNLARLLLAGGATEEAVELLERAELHGPRDLPLLVTRAEAHLALGAPGIAVAVLEKAVALYPDNLDARAALAKAALAAGQSRRSLAASLEVLGRDPEHAGAKFQLALGLAEDGKYGKAREVLSEIAERPEAGRLLQFLDKTEGRVDAWALLAAEALAAGAEGRLWDGAATAGTLVLDATGLEPQLVVLLLRLVPRAAARAGRLVLACDPAFEPLVRCLEPHAEIAVGAPPADAGAEGAWLPLAALPAALGLSGRDLPASGPYLAPVPGRERPWPASLFVANEPVVAVCWREAGQPFGPDKDLPFRSMEPLFDAPVRFLSLAYLKGTADAALMEDYGIADLAPLCRDLDDVAAVLAGVDLVITADGVIAHLAGALCRECWVALPVLPAWIWGRRGAEAPHYPSLRTFRAAGAGDWSAVIADLGAALRERLA